MANKFDDFLMRKNGRAMHRKSPAERKEYLSMQLAIIGAIAAIAAIAMLFTGT